MAAGVGELVVVVAAAAGAALQPPVEHPPVEQPLVQLVVMICEPQVLQPVVQLGAGAAQQGAGAAQQALRQRTGLQQRCLQQRASTVETENTTAATANILNTRLITNLLQTQILVSYMRAPTFDVPLPTLEPPKRAVVKIGEALQLCK